MGVVGVVGVVARRRGQTVGVELGEAVRRRHMVRSFSGRPVPHEVVDRLVRATLAAPSAGNTRGTAWIVLEGAAQTSRYWMAATTAPWRAGARRWPGLSRAAVVAVSLASPAAYLSRYAEPDKARGGADLGLSESEDAWAVPYWFADAAFGVMTLLLGATAEGLGACFLGNFRAEAEVLSALGVPNGWRLFGAVALGEPAGDDPSSSSLDRAGPAEEDRVHYGRWGSVSGSAAEGSAEEGSAAEGSAPPTGRQ